MDTSDFVPTSSAWNSSNHTHAGRVTAEFTQSLGRSEEQIGRDVASKSADGEAVRSQKPAIFFSIPPPPTTTTTTIAGLRQVPRPEDPVLDSLPLVVSERFDFCPSVCPLCGQWALDEVELLLSTECQCSPWLKDLSLLV